MAAGRPKNVDPPIQEPNWCENCAFYKGAEDVRFGHCHRNPPQIADRAVTIWPQVSRHDWCGEFRVWDGPQTVAEP